MPEQPTCWATDVVRDPNGVRGKISLTGQFATMDNSLTGMENIVLQARLLGFRRRAACMRAAELCDRIAVIDHGRIIAEGTPAS
jgi:ABC-type multidrug transport system ATPase subunit